MRAINIASIEANIEANSGAGIRDNNRATTGPASVWVATTTAPEFPVLMSHERADVCVIGAGIAGLTTAYMLRRAGKSVVVIDAAGVGAGESGRTSAQFFPPDERYFDIERGFGTAKAALVADVYNKATDCVESIIRSERIDCEFERLDGYLFSPDATWDDILEREHAVTSRLGLDVRRLERVPGLHFDTGPCLRFARQAQFHPLKYLNGLAEAIIKQGGRIFDRTRALALHGDSAHQSVLTDHGSVVAGSVVVCTDTPFNDRAAIHTRQTGYRSYVLGIRVPKDALPRMLLWDTGVPYYYVRLTDTGPEADHELLIVGSPDHTSGQDAHPQQQRQQEQQEQERYDQIEAWVRQRFPLAGDVEYRWSGVISEPSDGMPFLGRSAHDHDNVYIITGDSGNGMTHCTAGAILVSDLICGRKNAWTDMYSPARKAFHGIGDFLTEQANTEARFNDWLRGGDVDSIGEIAAREIAPAKGAPLCDDGTQLANCRAGDGGLPALPAGAGAPAFA